MRKALFVLMQQGIFITLVVTMVLVFTSFSVDEYYKLNEEGRFQDIVRSLPTINSLIKTDSMRIAATKKVKRFIDKYNKKMELQTKEAIANEIYEMSLKYENLDIDLICATITHESAFTWHRSVTSPVGAMGLMQIMPETGYFLSKLEGVIWTTPEDILFDPILNIRLGCRYLSRLIELYNLDGGLAAYNGGERQVVKWLASGRDNTVLFEETREYVPSILKLYNTYRN